MVEMIQDTYRRLQICFIIRNEVVNWKDLLKKIDWQNYFQGIRGILSLFLSSPASPPIFTQ